MVKIVHFMQRYMSFLNNYTFYRSVTH